MVPKRVLIIDDDETFRYVMKQIIRNEPRYEIFEASDGSEGLRLARDGQPDVIVLDLQMPNIDGFTVLQELNADRRTSVIPVIVSTSLEVDAELKARLPGGRGSFRRISSPAKTSRCSCAMRLAWWRHDRPVPSSTSTTWSRSATSRRGTCGCRAFP